MIHHLRSLSRCYATQLQEESQRYVCHSISTNSDNISMTVKAVILNHMLKVIVYLNVLLSLMWFVIFVIWLKI